MRKLGENKRTITKSCMYSPKEAVKLELFFSRSICQTVSEYIRKVSLEEPIEMTYRNLSLDRFVDVLIELRNTMEGVRKQWPGNCAKVDELIRMQEETKQIINKIADLCMRE
jgi:hypothetical protein